MTNAPTGKMRVFEEHAIACWNRLLQHCESGNCTCHIGADVSLNILEGCLEGRAAYDDYQIAVNRVVGEEINQ